MKKILSPSILAVDLFKLEDQIGVIERAGAGLIHLDIMDGHFVRNLSYGPLIIASLKGRTKLPFDVHLMVDDADRFISAFVTENTRYITVHQEACAHLHRTVEMIRSHGVKPGVALNPATSLSVLDYVLEYVDMVLIMSVDPGFGGQSFIPGTLQKIKDLAEIRRRKGLDFAIQVDGGINLDNAAALSAAGTDIFVAGGSVFRSGDIEAWINKFFSLV